MIEVDTIQQQGAKIRVIGVGGGGGNAINSMISRGLTGVDFVAANTDAQDLARNLAPHKIQLGKETTRGLGAGAKPEIGQRSAEEDIEEIREALLGSDMVFVTAGMGGGTGTGGAPVVARIARELGALVIGIVTKPFDWEARRRSTEAEGGINELRKHVDALITIPNQKLMSIITRQTSFKDAFNRVDDVLYNATRGIADLISHTGDVNVDFADVRTIMKDMGDALMGIGIASGEHRAIEAAQNALNSPLLEGISIAGAQGLLVNICGSSDLAMVEVQDAVKIIEEAAGHEVNLIFGIVTDENMGDKIMLTVVATGFKYQDNSKIIEKPIVAATVAVKPQVAQTQPNIRTVTSPTTNNNGNARPAPTPSGNERHYSIPKSSPSGVQQLQELDTPATYRRANGASGSIRINAGDLSSGLNSGYTNPPGIISIPRDNSLKEATIEKPAFLRKIMD
ncbi:MAG: cell division protein FtsZ [Ignavibacteriae bacterium]|nr:cell division protein FtsZ [Ignavibacteriota bacterium]